MLVSWMDYVYFPPTQHRTACQQSSCRQDVHIWHSCSQNPLLRLVPSFFVKSNHGWPCASHLRLEVLLHQLGLKGGLKAGPLCRDRVSSALVSITVSFLWNSMQKTCRRCAVREDLSFCQPFICVWEFCRNMLATTLTSTRHGLVAS